MFTGSLVALITPFQDGEVDFETLDELVEFHLQSGTDGIVPVGTTGESPTLSYEEHKAGHRARRQHRGRPDPRHRRHRLQQHRRGHRTDRPCPQNRR